MIPIVILFSVFIGTIARSIWGWLSSGEPFSKRKFAATMIFSIFAVALPIGASMFSSSMIVDTSGMVGICVAALIAGWGADSGLKEISKMTSVKPG